jgi:putative hemolysin
MTPRSRVVALPRSSSIEAALRVARESGYSRLPVYSGDLDAIDGIVHARDLFEAREHPRQGDIGPLVQPALVAPTSKKARELLVEMRAGHGHMVLVVDEHGAFVGIVTLEDVFEAIVGDIRDERDEPELEVLALGEGVIEVDGSVAVRELDSRHGLSLPESGDYVTVAGLVLARLGTLPTGGEAVEVGPYRLSIAALAGRRIARVRIEMVRSAQAV